MFILPEKSTAVESLMAGVDSGVLGSLTMKNEEVVRCRRVRKHHSSVRETNAID
jgi:hypothetical protein